MFSLPTPSGTAHADPTAPDSTGAVLYHLTGAIRGTVHVQASHHPNHWHEFTAVRVTLGAADALHHMPTAPLPTIRGRAYYGSTVRLMDYPADDPQGWSWSPTGIQDMQERDAPPQASETLRMVMRVCGQHYEARPDLPELLRLVRWQETPQLRAWLAPMITDAEQDAARSEREAEGHRAAARQCARLWWALARLFIERPTLSRAHALSDHREGLAHRANYLPDWAQIMDESAQHYRRRLSHYLTEREGLRHRGRRPAAAAADAPAQRTRRAS
ncbi:hypothetical protein [Streptomyces sp. 8N706]|uniref:hypothetical protein n=1 Tax=Streptomyces sp. 8N706 TaxID=3457416 RepID=UPI003FD2C9D3